MTDAFAWLGQLFEWFGAFVPRWTVLDTTQGAVKYVRGRPVLCEPGHVHWHWPVTTLWAEYPVARQTDRLETQTMETTCGKTFVVSGTITYSVNDLLALLTTTHNPASSVIELTASAVHDVCAEMSWSDLQREHVRGTLRTKLKNEAQRQLRDYGVTVIRVQLTSLARARVLKVSQSVSNEQ